MEWQFDMWSWAIGVVTPFVVAAIHFGITSVIQEKNEWNSSQQYELSKHHTEPLNPSQTYWKTIVEATEDLGYSE